MSAKPKLKEDVQYQVSDQGEPVQDIFVDGDPALEIRKQKDRPSMDDDKAGNTLPANNDLKIEKLTYVHQMLSELRKLSVTLDEPMVAYLIEMALLEADTALNVGQFKIDLGRRDRSDLGL